MWRNLFFLLCFSVFSCHPVAAQAQPSWFLITGSELQSFEQEKKNWESSRQDWLRQVSELKTRQQSLTEALEKALKDWQERAHRLQQESTVLNKALFEERQTTTALKQSLHEFEREKSVQLASLSSENASLKSSLSRLEGQRSWWRLLAVGLIAGIVVVAVFAIRRRMKR